MTRHIGRRSDWTFNRKLCFSQRPLCWALSRAIWWRNHLTPSPAAASRRVRTYRYARDARASTWRLVSRPDRPRPPHGLRAWCASGGTQKVVTRPDLVGSNPDLFLCVCLDGGHPPGPLPPTSKKSSSPTQLDLTRNTPPQHAPRSPNLVPAACSDAPPPAPGRRSVCTTSLTTSRGRQDAPRQLRRGSSARRHWWLYGAPPGIDPQI